MSGHEETVLIGKLSRDPELKYTQAGKPVVRLSLPIDRKVGEEYKTAWWNITLFGERAENVAQMAHKGTLVRVSGQQELDPKTMTPALYEKDGETKSSLKLIAYNLTYLDNFGKKDDAKKSEDTQEALPF